MPDVYSDIATNQNAPHVGDSYNDSRKEGGKERVVQAVYEADGLAADSVIAICKLRRGDIVLPSSMVMFDALGASTSLDIGDDDDTTAVDADRYADGIATTSAGAQVLNQAAVIDKIPYIVQKDCWLTATLLGAAGTGTIKFFMNIVRFGA